MPNKNKWKFKSVLFMDKIMRIWRTYNLFGNHQTILIKHYFTYEWLKLKSKLNQMICKWSKRSEKSIHHRQVPSFTFIDQHIGSINQIIINILDIR